MLKLLLNRRVLASIAVVAVLLAVALRPTPVIVDAAAVSRGPLVVTVDEEGQTRVRDRFVVSMPVAGRVLRIELEPGDAVKRGSVVARVRAETAPLLDARSRAEAEAVAESAKAARGRARAEELRARATLAHAERELTRFVALANEKLATKQQVEGRQADMAVAAEAVNAATFAVHAAQSELERALARLRPSVPEASGRVISVTAPADGVVLKRLRESESVLPSGDPLIEIGDPRHLEIVSDLLSADAVRIRPGARAMIEQWGGSRVLQARVKRIEPSGFTKTSALGVEEQRVNVILDFVDLEDAWSALGDAYRVEVRIVLWEAPSVVKVPTSALFRVGDQWAAYVLQRSRAARTVIEIGHQTSQEAEVIAGLDEGAQVVLHPPDTLTDGMGVRLRP